jgi:hypothetical protein
MKYKFVKEKIIFHYNRGCRFLNISKIVTAVLFILFTLMAIAVSHRTGTGCNGCRRGFWLYILTLRCCDCGLFKYLIESKVIPYLEDDNQVEFGEYDIFLEDIDNEDEDEEEENEERGG